LDASGGKDRPTGADRDGLPRFLGKCRLAYGGLVPYIPAVARRQCLRAAHAYAVDEAGWVCLIADQEIAGPGFFTGIPAPGREVGVEI